MNSLYVKSFSSFIIIIKTYKKKYEKFVANSIKCNCDYELASKQKKISMPIGFMFVETLGFVRHCLTNIKSIFNIFTTFLCSSKKKKESYYN